MKYNGLGWNYKNNLPKLRVEGSNPFSRSNKRPWKRPFCNLYIPTQVYLKEECINYKNSHVSGFLFDSIFLRDRWAEGEAIPKINLYIPTHVYLKEGCVNNKIAPRQRRFYLRAPFPGKGEPIPFPHLKFKDLQNIKTLYSFLSFKFFCQLKDILSTEICNFGKWTFSFDEPIHRYLYKLVVLYILKGYHETTNIIFCPHFYRDRCFRAITCWYGNFSDIKKHQCAWRIKKQNIDTKENVPI